MTHMRCTYIHVHACTCMHCAVVQSFSDLLFLWMCVCACVRVCVRACVRVCVIPSILLDLLYCIRSSALAKVCEAVS